VLAECFDRIASDIIAYRARVAVAPFVHCLAASQSDSAIPKRLGALALRPRHRIHRRQLLTNGKHTQVLKLILKMQYK
jgi:hypothetical protein